MPTNETEQIKYAPGKHPNSRNGLKNLRIPTSEEAKELGRRGGLRSAETRAKHRAFREIVKDILMTPVDNDEGLHDQLVALGLKPNMENAMILAAAHKAKRGDIESLRFLRDTIGEKPTEAYQMTVENKPIQAINLAELTDAELQALAARSAPQALPESTD